MQKLLAYFKQTEIKTSYVDADGATRDTQSIDEDRQRGRKAVNDADMIGEAQVEEDDDESEDESFEDEGSEESDQGEDMSMVDSGIDKDELKALAKNEQTKGKRGQE